MEIIYNNHSADAPSSNISQKLVVVLKCPRGYMRLVSMGLAGGLSLMVLGETRGVEEAVAPGLVQTVMGAPGLANLLFSSPPAEVGVSMGFRGGWRGGRERGPPGPRGAGDGRKEPWGRAE